MGYGDDSNGYVGFAGRQTHVQERPSVSRMDGGLVTAGLVGAIMIVVRQRSSVPEAIAGSQSRWIRGGNPVKLKTLFTLNAVTSVPFGIGPAVAPSLFLSLSWGDAGAGGGVYDAVRGRLADRDRAGDLVEPGRWRSRRRGSRDSYS